MKILNNLIRVLLLVAIIVIPTIGRSQNMPRYDTVKIRALVIPDLGKGLVQSDWVYPVVVKGYAVYKLYYNPNDRDYGFDRRPHPYIIRDFVKLLDASKKHTLKNIYDFKELEW